MWRAAEVLTRDELLAASKGDIWAMTYPQRRILAGLWREEFTNECCEELSQTLKKANRLQLEIRDLNDSVNDSILKGARIVGCTTSGAAMYKSLLSGPHAPEVVLVEEAAEILEPHVLSSVTRKTLHLIMIGDHMQLRPKIDNYQLSVVAGNGHDLNMSLFERLVKSGFPHTVLGRQHRMHPDLSAMIRPTYPSLEDHPTVVHHPPLKGVACRLAFVDHREHEEGEVKSSGFWVKGYEFQSKVNRHEVQMVVAIVCYLLQQGYDPG